MLGVHGLLLEHLAGHHRVQLGGTNAHHVRRPHRPLGPRRVAPHTALCRRVPAAAADPMNAAAGCAARQEPRSAPPLRAAWARPLGASSSPPPAPLPPRDAAPRDGGKGACPSRACGRRSGGRPPPPPLLGCCRPP